jgi:hypothetical protein
MCFTYSSQAAFTCENMRLAGMEISSWRSPSSLGNFVVTSGTPRNTFNEQDMVFKIAGEE